jgi:hypothetical protein
MAKAIWPFISRLAEIYPIKELKSIDPVSLGKMLAIIWAIFGFIAGLFAAIGLGATTGLTPIAGTMPWLPAAVGAFAIVLFPIVFAIMGFVAGVVCAFIYNVVAKRFGGVMLDL